MGINEVFRNSLRTFTPAEKRNIAFYIAGIMVYKLGLEAFNGSIVALATNRYDFESIQNKTTSRTFERLGLLTGLNQAFQCVGSILIGPLIKLYPTRTVLSVSISLFSVCTAILLVVDAATGGTFVPAEYRANHPKDEFNYYGKFSTDGMIPVYSVCGIAYGMVELIRRVIPRDIVGGDVQKLRKMDSMVHIFYEITGTAGAFVTALILIPQLGNNRAFIVTPVCFATSALLWAFITDLNFERNDINRTQRTNIFKGIGNGAKLFLESIWVGGKILFTSRKFIWLVPGYAIALYAHRYMENGLAPQVARRYFGESAWSQIMVGGSNFGELLGALFVFFFTDTFKTPIPWLRLDAIMLLVVWFIPFWKPPQHDIRQAWIVAAAFLPLSFGWAAGDVSISAYIQASLAHLESSNKSVSALGAVMSFLYSFYVITYAIGGTFLGRYLDGVYNSTGGSEGGSISEGLMYTAGVQFTVIAVLMFASTFVPRGSFAFNPDMVDKNPEAQIEDNDLENKRKESEGSEATVYPVVV